MRQPRRTEKIDHRIDDGHAGAQPHVDDVAPIDRDAGLFEPDVLDIADDADGEDDALDADDRERTDPAWLHLVSRAGKH
jgi:hypothetical protein